MINNKYILAYINIYLILSLFFVRFIYLHVFIMQMKRKVIKQGHDTMTVTLPKSWCRNMGIKGGDELNIDEHDNILTIAAQNKENKKSIRLSTKELERFSAAKIISASYELGFDKIFIDIDKNISKCWDNGEEEFVNTINYYVDRLMGFEVTSHVGRKMTIENLSQPLLKFESVISRIFSMIIEGLQNYIEAVEKKDKKLLADAEMRHDNITRFCSLALRIICYNNNMFKTDSLANFVIVNKLDKFADFFRYIYKDTLIDKRNLKGISESAKKTLKYVETFRSFYSNYDINKMNDLDNLRGELKKLSEKAKHKNDVLVTNYLYSLTEFMNGTIKPRILMEIDKKAI